MERIGYQITNAMVNSQLFSQLQSDQKMQRQLTQKLVSAQEEERLRVSRELHDDAGQGLTALKLSLELLKADLPPELTLLHQQVGSAIGLTEDTMNRIRFLAQDLRPPGLDQNSLNDAIDRFCKDFSVRTNLPIEYVGTEVTGLTEEATVSIYRCVQEALTNVVRHSNASHARVELRNGSDTISLTVEDDGKGLDMESNAESTGLGLLGMTERLEILGGKLEIDSKPGLGTRLTRQRRSQILFRRRRDSGR